MKFRQAKKIVKLAFLAYWWGLAKMPRERTVIAAAKRLGLPVCFYELDPDLECGY